MFIRLFTAAQAAACAVAIDVAVAQQPAPHTEKSKLAAPSAAKKGAPGGKAMTKSPLRRTGTPGLINVGELLARAAGYKIGLRTVDSVLLEGESLNVEQLATLVDELEILIAQRRDLLLYERLVTGRDRDKLVKPLAFPRTTISLLGSRVAALHVRLSNEPTSDDPQRHRQLQALDKLLERLTILIQKQ
jgi:hypothetical protein